MLKKSKLLSAAVVATAAFMASPSHADTMGTPKISAMSILNGLENPWIWPSLLMETCFSLKNVKVYQ